MFNRVKKPTNRETHSFSDFLNKIVKSAISTEKEEQLQKAWFGKGDWCEYFGLDATSKMFDTHAKPLENGRKPDIVHVVPGFFPAEPTIVAVGDLKRLKRVKRDGNKGKSPIDEFEIFSKANFSPDSRGRAIDFARVIYEEQPFRKDAGVLSYVSNGNSIVFYLYRGPDNILESPPLPLNGIGGQWYFGHMTTNLSDFGMVIPRLTYQEQKINVESCLGSGSTGIVFLCSCESIEGKFAMKMFPNIQLCRAERVNIEFIRSKITLLDFVVRVVGETDDNLALILQPVCDDISRGDFLYTGDQLIQLINVVKEINISSSLLLRDLRPSNILVQNDGRICLIDFGSAATVNAEVLYQGTSKFASLRILHALDRNVLSYTTSLDDDYQSLVRLCYVSINSSAYAELKSIGSNDYRGIIKFWNSQFDMVKTWSTFVSKQSIDEADFDNLIQYVVETIPTNSHQKA
jgi:hypothetical protein